MTAGADSLVALHGDVGLGAGYVAAVPGRRVTFESSHASSGHVGRAVKIERPSNHPSGVLPRWHQRWYHTPVAIKTTVYLPDDLKAAVERLASQRGTSEAEVIRTAIRTLAGAAEPPRPRVGYAASGDGSLASRVDELLEGFGER